MDSESIGRGDERARTRRGRRLGMVLVASAMVVTGGVVAQDPERFGFDWFVRGEIDSDGDGIPDDVELAGWETSDGSEHRTDPHVADSDGDGLEDGEEADLGLDPNEVDTDGDGIDDGREALVVGTAPGVADTDGDGFDDGYEDEHAGEAGLDPLVVDVKVDKKVFATDLAIGSLAGDAWRKDSVAWLIGNLASGGFSSIPVIGWVVGAIADLRDAIASAIHGDWVGSGFSAAGLVPYGGDAVAIPGKAAKFVSRNPELAVPVAAAVAALPKVSDEIKFKSLKKIHPGSKELLAAGAGKKPLVRLAKGRVNLDALGDAVERRGHVRGATGSFLPDGPAGEAFIESVVGKRAQSVST